MYVEMIGLKMMGKLFDGALSHYSKRAIHETPMLTLVYWKTTSSPTTTTTRLKREDTTVINYDSAFSQWKIIIGVSNWKDHSAGKEGAEKYRTQNLPNYTSPGFYEIGIATSAVDSINEPRKIDSSFVIPVYLGQADNVRARVQKYGRDGAHLENTSHSLFSDIFSVGFPIAYRWVPTKSKEEAERREEELLGMYDYAWNKRNNGDRRSEEICGKLRLYRCARTSLISILRRYLEKKLEIGDELMKSGEGLLCRMLAMMNFQRNEASFSAICGVSVGHGVVCTKPPVRGRKRCDEHKGVKANRQHMLERIK